MEVMKNDGGGLANLPCSLHDEWLMVASLFPFFEEGIDFSLQ